MSKGNGKYTEADYEPAQMPPHSQEAEEAVLGSILINPAMLLIVMVFLKIEHFFVLRNAWVYEAMIRLHDRGEVIDYITLIDELRSQKRLDEIGGAAYVTYLTNNVGNSFDAESYAGIVYRSGLRRGLLDASTEIARLARVEDMPINKVIDAAEDELSKVTGEYRRGRQQGLKPVSEVIELATEIYPFEGESLTPEQHEAAALTSAYDDYVDSMAGMMKSGYHDLDDLILFHPGLYTVAARPRVGKSMLMQNILYNNLIKQFVVNFPVHGGIKLGTGDYWINMPTRHEIDKLPTIAMFSAEMTTDQINKRLIAMITGVSTRKQMTSTMNFDEFQMVEQAKKLLKSLKDRMLITSGTITPGLIRSEIRLWQPDLVEVDYTQKLKPGTERFHSKADEISHICGELQDIAIVEDVPVIAGAQINRDGSSAPTLENLKGSGSIEEDSDVVVIMHRPELYEENCDRPNEVDLIVAKNRNGTEGVATVLMRKSIMQLANLKKTQVNLGDF